ncbi:transposable element Tcb2 transposase [Trichonephila clavipes]|nr:transposable element Tcb2 transposase [Trichonephila clavipes]
MPRRCEIGNTAHCAMAREDHHLLVIAKRNRGATASQLSCYLYEPQKPVYQGRVRLEWCRQHRDWSMDQWATVLFTNESRFSLNTDSRHTFIWREPGTRYLPSNVLEIDNYRREGLMV